MTTRSTTARQAAYPCAMNTIELDDEELRIVREALRSYRDDFGHEEADVLRVIRRVLEKLPNEK
jgi:hypothetical protein